MRVSRMAAQLCAASLGTQCAILDRTFRTMVPASSARDQCASSICKLVKAVPDGAERCAATQQDGARRAVQVGAAYFYACHAELVEGIVPVQFNGSIEAYILVGPLLLAPPDALLTDKIIERLSCFHIPEGTVRQEIERIPVVEAKFLKSCLKALSELVSAASVESDSALPEADAGAEADDAQVVHRDLERAPRNSKGSTNSPTKQRFILARARLGNLVEVRQDVSELIWRTAKCRSSLDVARAAALHVVSALWGTALERDVSNLRIDTRNLGLPQLFKAETHRDILDWAVSVAARVARDSEVVSRETRTTLKKVQTHTRRCLSAKLSSADVAKALGMTARELERMLEDHLGISFRLFLTMERFSLARRLLRESRLTATQIAAEIGFTDQSNFTKTFVKLEGVTPIEYRTSSTRNTTSLESSQS